MSKSSIVIVVLAVLATAGAYRVLKQGTSPTAPPVLVLSETPKPERSNVEHGEFNNRFHPTMPLSIGFEN